MIAIALLALQLTAPRLANDLRAGLELHYESTPQASSPWTVDSVAAGVELMPGAQCARFTLRRGTGAAPNESRLCVARDTLFGWDARRNVWTAQRPVAARMTFVQARANGDTVRYSTDTLTTETISGLRVVVLPTTVLTVDSLGRPKRRLRERYSLSLASATGGTFEVPDAAAVGQWRAEQSFELRRLVPATR
jgi:hypothetical protein